MLLTPGQLQEIRRIIQDYHYAFVVNVIGPTAVAPEILAKLKAKGLVDVRVQSIRDAYIYGQLLAHLDNPAIARMTYTQFRDFVRRNPIPMTPVEQQAVKMAENNAGQYCVGLGNRVDVTTGQTLIEADAALRNQLKDTIKTEVAESIARRESVQKLASNLGHATGDWSRDWRRIANTEVQTAMQTGLADQYREDHGAEVRVAKVPMHDACFRAGTLIQTQRGLLPIEAVQVGELVLTHKMRWRPVTHLFQRSFSGKLYGVNGHEPRSTGNHPFLVDLNWKRIDSIERGQYVIEAVDAGEAQHDPTFGLKKCFFDHVSAMGASGSVPVATVQLYRYLQARDSDIHIEWADGYFRDGHEALKFLAESERFGSSRAAGVFPGLGFADLRLWATRQFSGFPGILGELVSFFFGHALQPSSLAVGLGRESDAVLFESLGYGCSRNSESLSQRFQRVFSGLVSQKQFGLGDILFWVHGRIVHPHAVRVKSIATDTFTGDVFNLEVAEDQSYVADGFVVHNCKECKRLFLGPDGMPRIWRLSDLQAFGTNVGRKTRDWVPTVGTIHPHCLCQLVRIPKNFGFDASGRLVPGGKLGVEAGAGDFMRALALEDELHKSLAQDDVIDYQGIPIRIEQRAGELRHWESATGERGSTQMLCAYGEVVGTHGDDGDPIDVYVGTDPQANTVYVIHQQNPATGISDEQKCMLGFPSEEFALQVYRSHLNKPGFDVAVSPMGIEQFKTWARESRPKPDEMMALVIPLPMEKAQGGPFIGPRGGKWADPEHTIPWKEQKGQGQRQIGLFDQAPQAKPKEVLPVEPEPKKYRYGVPLRPISYANVPKGWVDKEEHPKFKAHGVAVYDHPLSPEEIESFELEPILEPHEVKARIQQVSQGMGKDYAKEYVELAEEDPDLFKQTVHQAWSRTGPGHMTVEDIGQVEQEVLAELKRMATGAEKPEAPKAGPEPKKGDQLQVNYHASVFGDRDSETYHVIDEKDDQVQLSRSLDTKYGPWMPKVSVKHFVNDLAGKVEVPPSEDPRINAVATGKAKLLGKGDDGMAFQVGDQIVKVSTTVPYQPENSGHRTPEDAANMLRQQVEMGNHLADLGIKGIQRSEFVKHGDKGFQIREMLGIPKTFTREQLDKIQDTLIDMHKHGYALKDAVQPGLDKAGNPVFYDVGKAAPITGPKEGIYSDVRGDMDNLSLLYRDSGEVFVRRDVDEATQAWQHATGSIKRWKEKGATDLGKRHIQMAADKRRAQAKATLKGDALEDALADIDFEVKVATHDLTGAPEAVKKAEDQAGIAAFVAASGSLAGNRNPGCGTAPNFLFNVPIRGPSKTDPRVFQEMIEDENREELMVSARRRRRRDRRIYNVTKPVPDHVFTLLPPIEWRSYEKIRDGKHKERQNALKQFELDNTGLLNEDHAFIRKAEGGPYVGPRGGKWADPEHTQHWEGSVALPHAVLSADQVVEISRQADATGKQARQNMNATYESIRRRGDHVLVRVPLSDLDAEIDQARESGMELSDAQKQRIVEYMKLEGEPPPIRIQHSAHSAKSGKHTAFVADGNHRVAVARARGQTHIDAMMPKEDYLRWLQTRGQPEVAVIEEDPKK